MAGEQQEAVVDMSKCKTAVFTHATILCKAGLNDKALPMTTRKAYFLGQASTFIKMAVGEPWLCKAVTGATTPCHTSIGRTSLLVDLMAVVKRACEGDIPVWDEDPAVAGEGEDEDDPMNDIDAFDMETPDKKIAEARSYCPPEVFVYSKRCQEQGRGGHDSRGPGRG